MNRDKTANMNAGADDSDLIRSFNSGNHTAFERIVLKYQDRIYNLCYRFLGDMQEAEDAAQEIFIKVFKGLKRFRAESSFYTWIYRIAVNTCKNRVKSLEYRKGKKNVELPDETDTVNSRAVFSSDRENGPEEYLEKKERVERIQNAINELHHDWKTIIILRDIEGLSYEEISEITGSKLGTVKSKLSRARQDLRERLKGIF